MAALARVIIGASGSPGSLAALRYAEFLARSHDAVLVPVLAWEPPGGDRAAQLQPTTGLVQTWREMACERLRDALASVWGEPLTDPLVEPRVERGPAGWVLVNVADQPGDVLVLGAGDAASCGARSCARSAGTARLGQDARWSWYRLPTWRPRSAVPGLRGGSGTAP